MSVLEPGTVPPIRFAKAKGARIAYQDFGEGPATIVSIPPTAQNIEMAWEWPVIHTMLERFASFSRFIHFDKRGTGSSDRFSEVNGIDERVEDLRAVMDHAGIDRAHLFASSEGGPMAILFAASYPERVESLILSGTGATLVPDDLDGAALEDLYERQDRYAAAWGTPESPVVDGFAPSLAGDLAYRQWHQRYERHAAGSDSLRQLLRLTVEMDVREVLAYLDVPTLVIHRTGDRIIPIEMGRDLAQAIPGARLLELPGDDHFNYSGDVEAWMSEVERFVTGGIRGPSPVPRDRSRVRILCLGRFEVTSDGDAVPVGEWGTRLSRQLCKRLVAARGWPVSRDELMELLWPGEHDRRRLSARLSVQLSTVRRVLRGGVVADQDSVRLDLEEVSTDLEDLYRADDDAAIVAAYGGEFLPADRYDDWTRGVRDEARLRFLQAGRRLVERLRQADRPMKAAEVARRMVEADRYSDDNHQVLIRCLIDAGEYAAARNAHELWVAAMDELDIPVQTFEEVWGT